jgi:uncharacterized membrane protein
MTEQTPQTERSKQALEVYARADPDTREIIKTELDRVDELNRREADLNSRGLNYGVIVTLAFLAACVFLISSGHGVEGTILGVIFILALVTIFVVGRRQ